MRNLSLFRRLSLVALTLVQMGVPTLVVVADARLDAKSGVADRVHIEDHTHAICHTVHPDKCALCSFLSHFTPQRSAAPAVPVAMAACSIAFETSDLLPSSLARAQQRTRAPPVA
jgi:hypothetical protein